MRKQITFLFVLLISLFDNVMFATHIRAADISAQRIGTTRYKIILKVYTDYANVNDNPNSVNPIKVDTFSIGFGNQKNPIDIKTIRRVSVTEIVAKETFENVYELIYDFPAANQGYKIFFVGSNRNENVINISNSVNSLIYVETFVYIDGFSPINTTPRFTVPPIDVAAVNKVYTHNPGAYDLDGDSLSFEIIDPRDRVDKSVDGYRSPADPSFGTPSSFKIDPKTGLITWDTPKIAGEYNIAFRVNEYRNGVRIGFVVRDMQINVINSTNNPPIVSQAKDTCIGVGELYKERISASDPDQNAIEIELYGSFAEKGGRFQNIFRISPDKILADLVWTPNCNAIGILPIQAIVRVVDNHPVSLSSFKTWNIQVIGQKPILQNALAQKNQITINWLPYSCQKTGAKISIYRRECDTTPIIRTKCTAGVPEDWGFLKIGEVAANQTSFIDNGQIGGLSSSTHYFYLISVQFVTPSFGESYASNVINASLDNATPLITQLSYDKTKADAFLNISWQHFQSLDTSIYKPNYTYSISNNGNVVYTQSFDTLQSRSISLDTNLFNLQKNIALNVLDNTGQTIGSQSVAFSEHLLTKGTNKALNIQWTNKNAVLYAHTLFQKIYSFAKGKDTLLIDSVPGGITAYQIKNLQNGDSVCAFVQTSYTYCIADIDTILYSYTNTQCDLIRDNIAPCPPVIGLKLIDCTNISTANALDWIKNSSTSCEKDIARYELYKQNLVNKDAFIQIESFEADETNFLDLDGEELNCYLIYAIDSSENKSAASNIVCQDFCGAVLFPNIFTPNGDGQNDNFLSETNFAGFEDVTFMVYNRWGKEIYRASDFVHLSWNGIGSNGTQASDGMYFFYISGVRLTGTKEKMEYKGWIYLVR